jgi:hypothetical protein
MEAILLQETRLVLQGRPRECPEFREIQYIDLFEVGPLGFDVIPVVSQQTIQGLQNLPLNRL